VIVSLSLPPVIAPVTRPRYAVCSVSGVDAADSGISIHREIINRVTAHKIGEVGKGYVTARITDNTRVIGIHRPNIASVVY